VIWVLYAVGYLTIGIIGAVALAYTDPSDDLGRDAGLLAGAVLLWPLAIPILAVAAAIRQANEIGIRRRAALKAAADEDLRRKKEVDEILRKEGL
jgi:ABC-type transport system involved in cytochrome c biogenesis permease component